jgi:hypothetical protein
VTCRQKSNPGRRNRPGEGNAAPVQAVTHKRQVSAAAPALNATEQGLAENQHRLREASRSVERPLDQLAAIAAAHLRFHLENPGMLSRLGPADGRSAAAREPERARIARLLETMVGEVAEAIERAVGEGEARPVDPLATAIFLWGAWNGAIELHARGLLGEPDLRAALDQGRELLTEGLRSRA